MAAVRVRKKRKKKKERSGLKKKMQPRWRPRHVRNFDLREAGCGVLEEVKEKEEEERGGGLRASCF